MLLLHRCVTGANRSLSNLVDVEINAPHTFAPGSDIDVELIQVDVTGVPKLVWNEEADSFQMTHPLMLPGAIFGGTISTPDIVLTGGGATNIQMDVDDERLSIAPGTDTNKGGNLVLYGPDHPTKPGYICLRQDADDKLLWNGEEWNFKGVAVNGLNNLSGSLKVAHSGTPNVTIERQNLNGELNVTRGHSGLELIAQQLSSSGSKYPPIIKWMSDDENFVTENPKLLAFIAGAATEPYGSDADGGMKLIFGVTPNNPGDTNIPVVALTLDQNGNVIVEHGNLLCLAGFLGIGTPNPVLPLEVRAADDNQAMFFDDTAQAKGVGGGIQFGGKYTDGGAEAMGGRIGIQKTNATSGHVGFDMVFATQNSVGAITERAIFTSEGFCGIGEEVPTEALDVGGNIHASGNVEPDGTVDGRDVATDGAKLDEIDAGAEVNIKEKFYPAGVAILGNNASFQTDHVTLPDEVSLASCSFTIQIPSVFSGVASGFPKVVFAQGTGGTGNYRIAFVTYATAVGEQIPGSVDGIAEFTKAAPGASAEIWEESIAAAFDNLGLSAGDYVSVRIDRDSDDSADTFAGDLDVLGVVMKYD